MWGMFKKKADKPTINSMDFKFSCVLDVDSSVGDEELLGYLRELVREVVFKDSVKIVIDKVSRNGEGIIEEMEVEFRDFS